MRTVDGGGAPAQLRVEGLGPLTVFVDDEEIDLGAPKRRTVFAVLALCVGATVSRGELVDRVWGESAPATASGSLHTYLSGLRHCLGPARSQLVSTPAGYRLRLARGMFDVTLAEDLAERARAARGTRHALGAYDQALAPWTAGTILAGVPGPFVAEARSRLAGLRLQLLIEHAELAPQSRLPEVADRLLAEVPAHPFDERLRCEVMNALHRGGRTAEALAQYDDLRRALAAELGISPAPATQAGYAAILADDRGRAGRAPPAVRPGGHAPGEPVRPA